MTTPPAVRPRVTRTDAGAWVGGVAAGIAAHTGWSVRAVRLLFAVMCLFSGFGAVLYAAYWIVLPPGSATLPPLRRRRRLVQVVVAAALTLTTVGLLVRTGTFLLPAVLACVGAAFLWRQADDSQRRSWGERSRTVVAAPRGDRAGRLRLFAGAGLVLVALGAALARTDVRSFGNTLIAVAVAGVGLALLTGPWWLRLVGELGHERRERIRSEERAELAARVHDSVLQTLALIQRRADSPREVARLARGQERELRTLLWGNGPQTATTVVNGLKQAAAEVEDGYAVAVDVVAVGDAATSEAGQALIAAAREAMLNAAKHADVKTLSLYIEIEAGAATVYVRDRGRGFDPAAVPADRQGLRRSVAERMTRYEGRSAVRSAPGAGTEIELEMQLP